MTSSESGGSGSSPPSFSSRLKGVARSRATIASSGNTFQLCVGHEAIAHAGFGADVARQSRVRLQLAAKARHIDTQVVSILGVAGAPDFPQQLPVGEHPTGIGDEQGEQPVFDGVRWTSESPRWT